MAGNLKDLCWSTVGAVVLRGSRKVSGRVITHDGPYGMGSSWKRLEVWKNMISRRAALVRKNFAAALHRKAEAAVHRASNLFNWAGFFAERILTPEVLAPVPS